MTDALSSGASPSLECDRRTAERAFPRRRTAALEVQGERFELQLLDESEGGLGLYCGSRLELANGDIVFVHVDGQNPRSAEVRYVRPLSNGGFHVGLQWT